MSNNKKAKKYSTIAVVLSLLLVVTASNFFFRKSDLYQEEDTSVPRTNVRVANPHKGLTNVGISPFNLTNPKLGKDGCQKLFDRFKGINSITLGYLFNTFGNDNSCLNRFIADPRLETLKIYLINESCHRANRCGSYEFLHPIKSPSEYDSLLKRQDEDLKRRFFDYVKPVQEVISRVPTNVDVVIVPGQETNVSPQAFRTLAKWSREAFPGKRINFNPIKPGGFSESTGDIYEQHNLYPQVSAPCMVSLDGSDINFEFTKGRKSIWAKQAEKDPNFPKNFFNTSAPLQAWIEQYANTCETAELWVLEDNCNGDKLEFVDPRKRTCSTNKVEVNINQELLKAHKEGKRTPDLKYDATDNLSLKKCKKVRELKDTKMAGAVTDGTKKNLIIKQAENPSNGTAILINKMTEGKQVRKLTLLAKGKAFDTFTKPVTYAHNKNQWLFRSNKKPSSYPFKAVLSVDDGRVCYKIPNPRIRND